MDYKKMSYISGIVIFFSFVILLIAIIGLAEKRIFFTHDYIIYVKFSDVVGLQDQARVYMRGYKVGWTKDVQFKKDKVIVRVDINKKFKVPIDSKFEINTISLLGEKAITIIPGASDTILNHGDHVVGQNKDIMMEMKNILGILKSNIEQGELDVKVKQLSESIETFHSILGKIDKKIDKVNIDEYNTQIKNIGEAGKTIKTVLTESADSLQLSRRKFDKAIKDVSVLSSKIQEIAAKINTGEGTAGALVNDKEYIVKLDSTISELKLLIEDFKKNPKKYVNISVF